MIKYKYLAMVFLLAACANTSGWQHANSIAQTGGLVQARVQAGRFMLNTYSRIQNKNKPIHVYIEGDGLAWLSKNQVSPDPTPREALALQLASLDTAENVVYLARPCQFYGENCTPSDWTNKRFAEEFVASMNEAVDAFASKTNQQPVHLIGYSGGGAIAVLVAARRNDVASIRTVAGNLNHAAVNAHHGVSAMPESLNPIDFAKQIAHIPQLHFVGEDDTRIPAKVAVELVQKQQNNCAKVEMVAKVSHTQGWQMQWPVLLKNSPVCNFATRLKK